MTPVTKILLATFVCTIPVIAVLSCAKAYSAERTPWGVRSESEQNTVTEERYRRHLSNELLKYATEWCEEQGRSNDAVCITSKWQAEMGKRGHAVGGAQ